MTEWDWDPEHSQNSNLIITRRKTLCCFTNNVHIHVYIVQQEQTASFFLSVCSACERLFVKFLQFYVVNVFIVQAWKIGVNVFIVQAWKIGVNVFIVQAWKIGVNVFIVQAINTSLENWCQCVYSTSYKHKLGKLVDR